MTTGFLWDELYAWHDTGTGAGFLSAGGLVEPEVHGESAATKRRLRNLLDVTGLLGQMTQLRARPATEARYSAFTRASTSTGSWR